MKPTFTRLMAVAALGFFLVATSAQAAELSFGVIDMSRVMKESDAAKGIFKELDSKRGEYQKQVQKEEDALRTAEQEILKQKDKMSEDEFKKARAGFEEKLIAAQKQVQTRKKTLDDALNTSIDKLRAAAAKETAAVAKEKGYAAVFTQDAVMLAEPGLDLTDEVVKRLNASTKKIPIQW